MAERHPGISNVSPTAHIPEGFLYAGRNAGIKVRRRDLGLVLSAHPAAAAGVVTRNRARAACTDRADAMLPCDGVRAIVTVSGNANALTGPDGARADEALAEAAAAAVGVAPGEVVTACTGIIGVPLPTALVEAGLGPLSGDLTRNPEPFAESILTTDTTTKIASRAMTIGGKRVRLLGVAKGSGMIHPSMATMLCFLTTDLKATPAALQAGLRRVVGRTFNRISVDRDMSTNDMVTLLANGAAMPDGDALDALPPVFEAALEEVCRDLAKAIARDGEGATRLLEVTVRGATDEETAAELARSVTESPLFKSALFSGDPNWGRALAAVGARATIFEGLPDPREAAVTLQGITVFDGAPATDVDTTRLRHLMQSAEVRLDIALPGDGAGEATVWGCDLSYEYVRINADIAATVTEASSGGIGRVNEVRRLSPRMRHELLVDCLDHIRLFRGLIAVIRVGGEAGTSEPLREALARDLLLLRDAGLRPIVVHGAGPELSRSFRRIGDELQVIDGVPETRGEATEVLEETLVGRTNKDLIGLIHRLGGRAVGLSGKDGVLLRAHRHDAEEAGGDGSAAGVIDKVDPTLLDALDSAGFLPVIAPIGVGPDGETVALSADHVAAEIAVAVGARKLIFLGDSPGLLDGTTHITSLRSHEARRLLGGGELAPGTAHRVEAGLRALAGGVQRVHLVDGRVPHNIVGELFTRSGVGTLIRSD